MPGGNGTGYCTCTGTDIENGLHPTREYEISCAMIDIGGSVKGGIDYVFSVRWTEGSVVMSSTDGLIFKPYPDPDHKIMAFHNKYYGPNSSSNLKDEAEFRKDFVSVYEPLRKVEAEQRDGSYYHVMSSFDKLGKLIGVECDPTMMAEMKAYLRGVVHTIEKKNTQAAFLADFEKAQRK